MEWISSSEAYSQAKAKEDWVLAADFVSIIGLGGSPSDMHVQLLRIIHCTGPPVNKDEARIHFERRDKARTKRKIISPLRNKHRSSSPWSIYVTFLLTPK